MPGAARWRKRGRGGSNRAEVSPKRQVSTAASASLSELPASIGCASEARNREAKLIIACYSVTARIIICIVVLSLIYTVG
jgi:hypothetical protein